MPSEDTTVDVADIKLRIVHTLSIYPLISPSMLSTAMQNVAAAGDWRPALEELIEAGEVKRSTIIAESPGGRHMSYMMLHLPSCIIDRVWIDGKEVIINV